MPAPWVRREATISPTHIIFGANLAVFVAMLFAAGPVMDFPSDVLFWGENKGVLTLSGDWWRLLTYMFIHGGVFHFAINMWCLWDLGALCESLYGRWTFAAVYFLTGIAGGLATAAWNPFVPSVGASGAIFGLAGALLASFYLGEFSLPRIAVQTTLRSLVFFVGFNLVFGIFGSFFIGIDNACHIGGLISGLLLGALIARLAPEHDNPSRRAGVLFLVVLLLGVSALGIIRWRAPQMRYIHSLVTAGKNAERMIGELQTRIQQNPQDASAHYALAHAYFTRGQYPEGEAELKRVLELQPRNTKALMDLGEVNLAQDHPKEAQETFAQVIALEPNNTDAHIGLGMALADQQQHRDAIAEYKTAVLLSPHAGDVHYRLGISYAGLDQYDDAIAAYLDEKKIGDFYDLETALAQAYEAKGMTQQAQEARSKAEQLRGGR